MASFELNEVEQKTLDKLIQAIKIVYGDNVSAKITYCFTHTGIGCNVKVIIKWGDNTIEKDITDYDSW